MAKSNQHALAAGLQIRAARGFLCWDRRDLAKEAAVPSTSIERIETGDRPTNETAKNLSVIRSVLETKGIEFTEDSGVLGVRLHHSQRPSEAAEADRRAVADAQKIVAIRKRAGPASYPTIGAAIALPDSLG